MAILIVVDQWRSYVHLGEFVIYIDKRLIHLGDQRLHMIWQQKVFTKLGPHYKIVYKPRNDNRVANTLSHHGQSIELSAIFCTHNVDGYNNDPKAGELLTRLAIALEVDPHFSLHQGLLCYKGQI
jgi:hypothetical protein